MGEDMTIPTVSIVTKTYGPDLDRCELLCRSIDRHVAATTHWIVVDRRDRPAFRYLEGRRRLVVATEDLLPIRTRRITFGPFASRRNLWVSTRTRPMRGWLVQQIAKLAVATAAETDVLAYVDSDIVFIKDIDLPSYASRDVPLFCVQGAIDERLPTHVLWHRTAERILGLPPVDLPAPDFVGPVIFWRRENVIALLDRLAECGGANWVATLARASDVSEYTLYGRFVTTMTGRSSGHSLTERALCHSYWDTDPLDEAGLVTFLGRLDVNHVAVMLNPKAGMSPQWYGPLLERLVPRAQNAPRAGDQEASSPITEPPSEARGSPRSRS